MALTKLQINGFNLFIGKAKCGSCHFFTLFNELIPALYNKLEFKNLGTSKTNNFIEIVKL